MFKKIKYFLHMKKLTSSLVIGLLGSVGFLFMKPLCSKTNCPYYWRQFLWETKAFLIIWLY